MVMAYAYDLTGDIKYMNGVTTAMDYLLGTNPLNFSFITGYGSYYETSPHHRYWSKELDKTLPEAPDGILSGGPNAGLQDPYVRALGFVPGKATNPSQRCLVDSIEAWSTNEVTINWNAPLAWMVSFLQDEAAEAPKKDDDDDKDNTTTTTTPIQSGSLIYGDLNEDKETDLSDLTILSLYLMNDKTLSGNLLKAADVNGDGSVNLADLAHYKQYICQDPVILGPQK